MSDLPDIDKIIERQVRAWDLQRRTTEGAAMSTLGHLSEGPWISVSKQWGSGGVDFARQLAGELGWQVFDKEILAAIAQHTDSREVILSHLDEQAIGSVNDYISQLVVPDDPGRLAYVEEMVRVVWGLAKQGSAIILGRGANWFLDPRFGLRLRIVAPMERRVAAVARELDLPIARAERRVRAYDAGQAAFIRQVFDRNIDDPLGYDLVLNLGTLDLGPAVRVAVSAMRSKLALEGTS